MQSHTGRVLDCTGVQLGGMLDDLFYTDEPLGDHYCQNSNTHVVSVWVSARMLVKPELQPKSCWHQCLCFSLSFA